MYSQKISENNFPDLSMCAERECEDARTLSLKPRQGGRHGGCAPYGSCSLCAIRSKLGESQAPVLGWCTDIEWRDAPHNPPSLIRALILLQHYFRERERTRERERRNGIQRFQHGAVRIAVPRGIFPLEKAWDRRAS